MKTSRRTIRGSECFIVSDFANECRQALVDLNFRETETGYERAFPTTRSLDRIFERFAQCAEEMVLQAAGLRHSDWETALANLLERIHGEDFDWWLTGSAALAIRGVKVIPRDIDLVTTGKGALRLGRLLSDWLVEPVQESEGWVAKWFGRAFQHSRIEWVGDVAASVDRPEPSDFGPEAAKRLQLINWQGFEIRVPPLALQLNVSERRGLAERADLIRKTMGSIENVE